MEYEMPVVNDATGFGFCRYKFLRSIKNFWDTNFTNFH